MGLCEHNLENDELLQALDNEHVVRLYDIFPQGLGFVLVFEFMVSDLSEMIADVDNPLREPHVKTYMTMLLKVPIPSWASRPQLCIKIQNV